VRKKSLGQNFLYDPAILDRIVRAARLAPEDTVLEIGPGPGRLTRKLAAAVRRVIAVELDRELYARLREELAGLRNVQLVHGDALRYPYHEVGRFKVVANIPYRITTPLIFRLLEEGKSLKSMTLTVQKEVAERITGRPGTKSYGVLSIMVQYRGRASLEFSIPRGAFRPVPRVDSACLHIEVYETPPVSPRDEELFFRVVRTAFSKRRKTLLNSLRTEFPHIAEALEAAGIEPSRRPETLSIGEFARLSDVISRQSR
jgi:16S rRNA (adenine1518-N6/adenine1519-N6)-dimethyltransferase